MYVCRLHVNGKNLNGAIYKSPIMTQMIINDHKKYGEGTKEEGRGGKEGEKEGRAGKGREGKGKGGKRKEGENVPA